MDFTRREATFIVTVGAIVCAHCEAVAQTQIEGGCFIQSQQLDDVSFSNKPPTSKGKKLTVEQMQTTLEVHGDGFRQSLGRLLSLLAEYFQVTPGFAFYEDGNSPNALASPYTKFEGTDGTVLFGRNFLDFLLKQNADGDIAVAAICAHEFGHILQYKRDFKDRLPNPTVYGELHADFLSGWFLRKLKERRPQIGLQGVGSVWSTLGSTNFGSADWHGTNKQRVRSIEAGYECAKNGAKVVEAAESGLKFVLELL